MSRTRIFIINRLIDAVKAACAKRPDLLLVEYRERVEAGAHPLTGHCYVASEALYHLGDISTPMRPETVHHEGATHWYLRTPHGEVVDLTSDQFDAAPPYDKGIRRGFLTKQPSKRAQEIIDMVVQALRQDGSPAEASRTEPLDL